MKTVYKCSILNKSWSFFLLNSLKENITVMLPGTYEILMY